MHIPLVKNIVVIGNARDIHTVDWYRTLSKILKSSNVWLATDTVESENHIKIINSTDKVLLLSDIDQLLFNTQSSASDTWRNFIKLITTPIQVLKIKRINFDLDAPLFHAHSMFYIFLCWLANVKFVATPMGSDVLVRPNNSLLYKFFTISSLRAADSITLDSIPLKKKVLELTGKNSYLVQNGINISEIQDKEDNLNQREIILSIRGLERNYQIHKILESRALSPEIKISFIYPFFEEGYRKEVLLKQLKGDEDYGRLERDVMYDLLQKTILTISIPQSDSSPRSVYEAIFSGCAVALTDLEWVSDMPSCMMSRIILVDLENKYWLKEALKRANSIVEEPYMPSSEAYKLYDQETSMKEMSNLLYKLNNE